MTIDRKVVLRGIIPPLISPLLDRDTLDVTGLESLIEHVLAGGAHGVFALGTTGEGPHLSYAVRRRLIATTVRSVSGRVPVLVGISDTSYAESIAMARFSADSGADAVVVSVPYYLQASQDELFAYVKQLTRDVPLPLVLYNIPQMTKVGYAVDTVRRALDLEGVIGIKDSSNDMAYFLQLRDTVAAYPHAALLMGSEVMLADALRMGARGGVPGGANVFPELFVALYEAAQRDDQLAVRSLNEDVMQINRLLYSTELGSTAALKSIKCALSHLGICRDYVAPPLQALSATKRITVLERLEQIAGLRHSSIRSVLQSRMGGRSSDAAARGDFHPGANGRLADRQGSHVRPPKFTRLQPEPKEHP